MPKRRVHITAGVIAGLGAGLATARQLPQEHQLVHVGFATLGGVIGSMLPDVIEPATSPNHRGSFHSLLAAGGLTAATAADWSARCHRRAAECDARAAQCQVGSHERSDQELKALCFRALAGLIIGLIAGYGSHLLLDSTTSRSLPLISAHF
jgi:membrane-bound metal-dependent hydrolase YbcI (DUF457 family)